MMALGLPETARLSLRRFSLEDADFLYLLNHIPEVIYFTGEHTWTMQEVIAFIHAYTDYEQKGWGRYIVSLRADGEPVGFCGFRTFGQVPGVYLSYRFLPEYWQQGYATEICRELVRYGFEELGFSEIRAQVHPVNKASVRVAEKIGMQKSHTFSWGGEEWWEMAIRR